MCFVAIARRIFSGMRPMSESPRRIAATLSSWNIRGRPGRPSEEPVMTTGSSTGTGAATGAGAPSPR